MFQSEIIRSPAAADQELSEFFHSNPPTFFQSLHFLELLNGLAGFKPFMILLRQDNKIAATLSGTSISEGSGLKSLVSERTLIYGHPVIDAEGRENEALAALLRKLQIISKKSLFIQFRNDNYTSNFEPVFQHAGFRLRGRLNLIKPIHDLDAAWSELSASRRRQINNSRKNGLEIIEKPDLEQVKDFYLLLRALYKHRVRKPLPSYEFFEKFHALGSNPDFYGRIILCSFEGRIVGGIVCPFTLGGAVYEWYVCGLDKEYRDMKIYPSVMATWAAMEAGHRIGCARFDFMGLGLPERAYGVRDFKARFGGEWVNYGRWSRINKPLLYSVAELGYNVLRLIRRI
jgi:serine/alanine adding enzyme